MAGGDALAVGATAAGGGEITFTVVMSCLTAASSGLLLEYYRSDLCGVLKMTRSSLLLAPPVIRLKRMASLFSSPKKTLRFLLSAPARG
jgi:hypothetical protein